MSENFSEEMNRIDDIDEEILPPVSPDIFHYTDSLQTPDTLKITRDTVQ